MKRCFAINSVLLFAHSVSESFAAVYEIQGAKAAIGYESTVVVAGERS